MLSLVLGGYSCEVFLLTQYVAGAERLAQIVVLVIAFSVGPVRRFLEAQVYAGCLDGDIATREDSPSAFLW